MLSPGGRARRRGFTLVEVIVTFTLIAILAAVMVPTVHGRLQESYEDAIAAEFGGLATAIAAYRQDVGKYPPALDYLTALRASPQDRCGVPLSAMARASWRGPYISRVVEKSAGYVFAEKDTVNNVIRSSTSPTGIEIRLRGPDAATARQVDLLIDGTDDPNSGGLQWATKGTDTWISYIIPVKPGAC